MSGTRMKRASAYALVLLWAFLGASRPSAAAGEFDGPCDAQPEDAANMATAATWIESLQYTAPEFPSIGAVKTHHTAAYVDPGENQYYRVVVYNANLALRGLLRSASPNRLQVVELWLRWYLDHLDTPPAPPGIVYDHWYLADGTGETTCPDGIDPPLCDFTDAADSVAATLLLLAWDYLQYGGDIAFLQESDNKEKLEAVADAILALQQEDGLTWAKDTWRVKYTMDNAEVYAGLRAMVHLERKVFRDPQAARTYRVAAVDVRRAVRRVLFDGQIRLHRVARFENDTFQDADLDVWYPGSVALVWPHLFGVIPAAEIRAQRQLSALNDSWDGSPNPDWTTSVVDPDGFLWPSVGHAAMLAGDCTSARQHLDFVVAERFPDFDYPFTADDAGWLIMTLSRFE